MTRTVERTAAGCVLLLFVMQAHPGAIIRRHDRDDQLLLERARQYPQTAILRRAGARFGDAGTLVDPRWILTAAHVAAHLAAGAEAVLGGRAYRIDAVYRHPDWRTDADTRADVALVRLVEPVSGIPPARIFEGDNESGQVVTFVGPGGMGTGLTGPQDEDGRLRGATNRVERVDGSLLVFRFDEPADAGATELEGISGPGDSGGPAYLDRADGRFVIGVSSAQDSRPAGRQPGRYRVLEYYTRVSHFASWMRETMRRHAAPAMPASPLASRR